MQMRIAFFLRHKFHEPFMRSTYNLLHGQHHCQMFMPEEIHNSNTPFPMAPLRACIKKMIGFRPHVVISGEDISSLRLRQYMPYAVFVHTRHGLASKGITYKSVKATDYACVTSPFALEWYHQAGAKPRRDFWITGNVQMDALFLPGPPQLPFVLPPNKKVILYAPTFQRSISSVPMLGDRLADLLLHQRTDAVLVIKPHPLIATVFPAWMDSWRRLVATRPDVFLVEDTHSDVMPFLRAADVLVSDASSVLLQFLALNRPIILITSPHRFDGPYFDPNGLEWLWRDMGQEITDVSDLPNAINIALDDPTRNEERRLHYRQLLFADLADGGTAGRLAANVDRLKIEVASEFRLWLGEQIGKMVMGAVNLKNVGKS